MATVALVSLLAFVDIIIFVAVNAAGRFFIFSCFVLEKIVFVTLAAGYLFVFAI